MSGSLDYVPHINFQLFLADVLTVSGAYSEENDESDDPNDPPGSAGNSTTGEEGCGCWAAESKPMSDGELGAKDWKDEGSQEDDWPVVVEDVVWSKAA